MASDRWNYRTVELDGNKVLETHYSENDGWSYLKQGAERSIIVSVFDEAQAEDAIRAQGYHTYVEETLLQQLRDGKRYLTCFLDEGFAYPERQQ